jgi:carbamoyl-phosphate synthase large subunit
MNKEQTNAELVRLGFRPPRFLRAYDLVQLESVDWYPVVVKPFIGTGGSADCYIAQTREELTALAHYIGIETFGQGFLVQEYVGTPENEFTVGVLHDMDGAFLNSIAIRRRLSGQLNIRSAVPNRSGRRELGPRLVISSGISHGQVGHFPEVTRPCEQIAASMGARGPLNIQCRVVDGEVKVFEINPRFSGTTSIRAMTGYNEPDVLIRRHLLGETIQPRFPYRDALILRGLTETEVPA